LPILILAALAAYFQRTAPAYAATEKWTSGNGNWSTPTNWNNGAGPVPGAGDTVDITNTDGINRTIDYDYSGNPITLNSLTVDNNGGGSATLSMAVDGTALSAAFATIGSSGAGAFNQSGGTVSYNGSDNNGNSLSLGDQSGANGFYSLSGAGNLYCSFEETIGNNGNGTFIQTGGVNSVTEAPLYLGRSATSTGYYSLSGGNLNGGNEFIGYSGSGIFNQSGGVSNVSNSSEFDIGYASGSNGYYSLSGGSLICNGDEYVGVFGNGTINQSGGTNNAGISDGLNLGLSPQGYGYYFLSGSGALISYQEMIDNGTFDQSGGVNTINNMYTGFEVGAVSGSTGSYLLSGTGTLTTNGREYIGGDGNGTFNQTGGTNNVASFLLLGNSVGSTAVYTLSGGKLNSNQENIGYEGNGTFNQSGGINSMSGANSELALAVFSSSEGSYFLSGSGILATGLENIGLGGAAAFSQSGGTNTAVSLYISENAGSSGAYSITGGAATISGNAYVGGSLFGAGGTGTLAVSGGGQVSIGGLLQVWNTTGTGVIISGGNFTAAKTVNLASIIQTGGKTNLGSLTGGGTLQVGNIVSGSLAMMTVAALQQSSVTIQSTGQIQLTGGSPTNTINFLAIDSGGVLDLTNTQLFIHYGAMPDPISTIASYLATGYNGGHWNGAGINSTAAAANTGYGLGYADSADPGNPANLSSGTIEIMYTLLGDANLDGAVNGTDFAILASNFNKADQAGHSGWDEGDFNYDGSVNGSDFAELAANFNKGASQSDVAVLDSFASANGLLADVPEPASAAMMLACGLGIIRRRRRSSP